MAIKIGKTPGGCPPCGGILPAPGTAIWNGLDFLSFQSGAGTFNMTDFSMDGFAVIAAPLSTSFQVRLGATAFQCRVFVVRDGSLISTGSLFSDFTYTAVAGDVGRYVYLHVASTFTIFSSLVAFNASHTTVIPMLDNRSGGLVQFDSQTIRRPACVDAGITTALPDGRLQNGPIVSHRFVNVSVTMTGPLVSTLDVGPGGVTVINSGNLAPQGSNYTASSPSFGSMTPTASSVTFTAQQQIAFTGPVNQDFFTTNAWRYAGANGNVDSATANWFYRQPFSANLL